MWLIYKNMFSKINCYCNRFGIFREVFVYFFFYVILNVFFESRREQVFFVFFLYFIIERVIFIQFKVKNKGEKRVGEEKKEEEMEVRKYYLLNDSDVYL